MEDKAKSMLGQTTTQTRVEEGEIYERMKNKMNGRLTQVKKYFKLTPTIRVRLPSLRISFGLII